MYTGEVDRSGELGGVNAGVHLIINPKPVAPVGQLGPPTRAGKEFAVIVGDVGRLQGRLKGAPESQTDTAAPIGRGHVEVHVGGSRRVPGALPEAPGQEPPYIETAARVVVVTALQAAGAHSHGGTGAFVDKQPGEVMTHRTEQVACQTTIRFRDKGPFRLVIQVGGGMEVGEELAVAKYTVDGLAEKAGIAAQATDASPIR